MAGGERGYDQGANFCVFGPIEFGASFAGYAETGKDRAYAEGCDPARLPQSFHPCQALDGAGSQMIVVIVGNKDDIERGQVFEPERRRKETFRACPLGGSRALVPYGIDKDTKPVDFNQGRGMTEPRDAQSRRWVGGINAGIGMERLEWMPRG